MELDDARLTRGDNTAEDTSEFTEHRIERGLGRRPHHRRDCTMRRRAPAGVANRCRPCPTGVAVFPRDIAPPMRRFAERENNIVLWSEFDRGRHLRRSSRVLKKQVF
jgi:hypothetical protein